MVGVEMRKTGLALMLVGSLVAGGIAGATVAGFQDVEEGRFYSDPVAWAADSGITTGKTPTEFDPNGQVTRGEAVTFLYRFYNKYILGASPSPTGGVIPGDGVWLVGTEVTAGTYRTTVPEDSFGCYWARLSGTSGEFADLIANDNWVAGATVTVTIDASDVAFESSRCGEWIRI